MASGNKITFVELIKEYRISIPTIQRDYIQGRQDKKTKDVREGLIDNIVDKLSNNQPCHLNFTVGVIPDNSDSVFLLDGQQRITTLFLLHYYAAFKAGRLNDFIQLVKYDTDEKRFEYFTRYTTQRFLDDLVCCSDKFSTNVSVGKNIRQSNWYSSDYKDDVSIKSMLVVLETLDEKLKGKDLNDLFNKLFNKKMLTFFFLLDDKIEKPHEHYIKINSRGKDLTDFELFKSAFFEKMDKYVKDRIINQNLDDAIRKNINADWFEFLWKDFASDEEAGRKTDELFRLLIHSLFMSIYLSNANDDEVSKTEKTFETLLYSFGYNDCYAFQYCNYLSSLFELLKVVKNSDEDFYKYYVSPSFISDNGKIVVTQHLSKVFIFVLSHYAFSAKDSLDVEKAKMFITMMRNAIYNDDDIDGIEKVAKRCKNFASLTGVDFANIDQTFINKLDKFNNALLREELDKIELINKQGDQLKAKIFDAEKKLSFFNGRIAYALRLSADSNGDIDINVFDNIVDRSNYFKEDNYHILIAYFLSKVDYALAYQISDNSKIYTLGYNDTQHYKYHWRNLFNDVDGYNRFKDALKELLDSTNDINAIINQSRSAYLANNTQESFRNMIVKYPDLIKDYMNVNSSKYGRFWVYFENDAPKDYYLMKNTQKAVYSHFKLLLLLAEIEKESRITKKAKLTQNEEGSYRVEKHDKSFITLDRHKFYFHYVDQTFCSNENMTTPYIDSTTQTPIQDVEKMIEYIVANQIGA